MDKKNTMLLTIIAVATLLVTLVGATFAYFGVTTLNSSTTTSAAVTTQSIGTVTLAANATTLKINTEAPDMSEHYAGNADYYSVLNTSDEKFSTSENFETIFTVSSTNSSANTAYVCNANIAVTLSGTMASALQAGDAGLKFGGALQSNSEIDLTNLSSPYAVEFSGITDSTPVTLTAEVILHNTSGQQNVTGHDISNKTLTVTFTSSDFSCYTI